MRASEYSSDPGPHHGTSSLLSDNMVADNYVYDDDDVVDCGDDVDEAEVDNADDGVV